VILLFNKWNNWRCCLNGLVVGTNVDLGTAQDSAGVTTIIGDTVTTSFVNALKC